VLSTLEFNKQAMYCHDMSERPTRRALVSSITGACVAMLGAVRIAAGQEPQNGQLSPEQKKKADEAMANLQKETKILETLRDQYISAIHRGNAAEKKRLATEIAKQIAKMNEITERFGEALRNAE
jgi:hypothetical protein